MCESVGVWVRECDISTILKKKKKVVATLFTSLMNQECVVNVDEYVQ